MVRDFDTTRKQIVETARSYLGVAFRHQGRSRLGLDCLGLLVCVAQDCLLMRQGELIAGYDKTDYAHLPDEGRLYNGLCEVLSPTTRLEVGCVVLMQIDGAARHLGVVADYAGGGLSLIHAYAPARCVVEHRLDDAWRARITQIFECAAEA